MKEGEVRGRGMGEETGGLRERKREMKFRTTDSSRCRLTRPNMLLLFSSFIL